MSKCPTCGAPIKEPPPKRGTIRFRKGNRVKYGMDFGFYVGVPGGVDFAVTRCETGDGANYKLVAPGYGAHGDYGNGSLITWGLTKRQRARFERALQGKDKA